MRQIQDPNKTCTNIGPFANGGPPTKADGSPDESKMCGVLRDALQAKADNERSFYNKLVRTQQKIETDTKIANQKYFSAFMAYNQANTRLNDDRDRKRRLEQYIDNAYAAGAVPDSDD